MATLYLTPYEYISTRAFSTPAGVLSQLGHDILFHKNSLFSHVLADEAPPHSGRLRSRPVGREEVIKETKVDLAVRQLYLSRGHWVQTASVAGFHYYLRST